MSILQAQLRITDLKSGEVVGKGNHERLVSGFDGIIVVYQTKTDIRRNKVTDVRVDIFEKWLEGAEIKSEVPE